MEEKNYFQCQDPSLCKEKVVELKQKTKKTTSKYVLQSLTYLLLMDK